MQSDDAAARAEATGAEALHASGVRPAPLHGGDVDSALPPPRLHKAPAPYIVLVGLDLSEPGGRAWRFAFELAALKGKASEVHAVVVGPRAIAPPFADVALRADANNNNNQEDGRSSGGSSNQPRLKVLQHRSVAGQARLMAMHFRTGRPDRAIVQLARDLDADVIVVATQPATLLQRIFGGSVTDRIARDAPCPVVVVRPKAPHGELAPAV